MKNEEEFLFLSQEAKQYFIEHIEQEIANGVCGQNISWSLKEDGRLIISGKGIMDNMGRIDWKADEEEHEQACRELDYMPVVPYIYLKVFVDTAPWRNYRSEIKCVEIAEGIIGIGEYAFWDCRNLSSVWLPDTIETIEAYAFKDCNRLTINRLPSNLTYIGERAFSGNKALKNVTLSEDLTYIGPGAFEGCTNMSLSSKYLPKRLSTIGYNAFGGCWNLRQIVFPSGLSSIDDYAFADCHNLTDVEFSYGLKCIGESAFSGCKNIQEIEIPSTVENIKNYAFENCVKLKKIVFKGKFPKENCLIGGQYENYRPFREIECVDVYCNEMGEKFRSATTYYSWGTKKMYWHWTLH